MRVSSGQIVVRGGWNCIVLAMMSLGVVIATRFGDLLYENAIAFIVGVSYFIYNMTRVVCVRVIIKDDGVVFRNWRLQKKYYRFDEIIVSGAYTTNEYGSDGLSLIDLNGKRIVTVGTYYTNFKVFEKKIISKCRYVEADKLKEFINSKIQNNESLAQYYHDKTYFQIIEVPVTEGIICSNECFMGIDIGGANNNESNFALFDLTKKAIDSYICETRPDCNFHGEAMNIPRAVSDKGGYFIGDYTRDDSGNITGYKIEEYDKEDLTCRGIFGISELFPKDWFDSHRVADIARKGEQILVACYTDYKHYGSGFSLHLYFPDNNRPICVGEYNVNKGYLYGLCIDVHNCKLICRHSTDDFPDSPSLSRYWEVLEFDLERDLTKLSLVCTHEQDELSRGFAQSRSTILNIDEKERGSLLTGSYTVFDRSTNSILMSEPIGPEDYVRTFEMPELQLVTAIMDRPQCDSLLYVFCFHKGRWENLGKWSSDDIYRVRCDIYNHAAIVENANGSIIIRAVEE